MREQTAGKRLRDAGPLALRAELVRKCPLDPNRNSPSMSDHLIYVTDDSFDADVLKSDKPVLVDYWAEWCGPCKMIAPILDEVSSEYADKIKVAKLDVDSNQATSMKYGIRGIPTLMLFRDGSIVATHVGALSKSQLTAFIDSHT